MFAYGVGYFSDGDLYLYHRNNENSKLLEFDGDIAGYKARFMVEGWTRCVFLYSVLAGGRLSGVFVGEQAPMWNATCVLASAEGTFDEMWDKFEAYARML